MSDSINTPNTTSELRSQGLLFLEGLSEQGVINLDATSNIQSLSSGYNSSVYLVETSGSEVVVKFRVSGAFAEADAYVAWKRQGVPTPIPLGAGAVDRYEYVTMLPVRDNEGHIAIPLKDVEIIGIEETILRYQAENLAKMHSCIATGFGELRPGEALLPSWRIYLEQVLQAQGREISELLGITEEMLSKTLISPLLNVEYSLVPAYINRDYGAHNMLVTSLSPFTATFIDPDVLYGDPYLDLAIFINGKEVWTGVQTSYTEDLFLRRYLEAAKTTILEIPRLTALRAYAALQKALFMQGINETAKAEKYKALVFSQLAFLSTLKQV